MSIITTGNYPKALWPGVKSFFGRTYDEHAQECLDLYDVETSDKSREEDVEATGFGLAPSKPEGQSTTYDSDLQGYVNTAIHTVYSLGYIVTREEMDDNLYEEVVMKRAQALAFSMRQTKENVAANKYNNAFTSSLAGDGQYWIDSDHPTRSGNQSNLLTVAADLSEASIEDLCIQISKAKNNRGLRISLTPQTLHIAPDNMFEARRILGSQLQNDTANNAINALMDKGVFPGGVKVNHYFTDADAWFIRTNAPNGNILYQRKAVEFTRDNDFDTENFKAKGYERYVPTLADWRGLFGTPGA